MESVVQPEEVAVLSMGGQTSAVTVRETVERPQEQAASAEVVMIADKLLHDYQQGQPWPSETFYGKGGPDILQAVRLFCQKLNFERTQTGQSACNVLELDDIVNAQARQLASPLRLLCCWTTLVRIGVRKYQRDLLGYIAAVPMPAQGSVRLSQPADSVGKTHYVVTHLLGEKFLCRGYAMYITREGEWVLGGAEGNRWSKDLWLTPGLQSVDAIVGAKRRKLEPSGRKSGDHESAFVKRSLDDAKSRLERTRQLAGLDASKFGAAHGARFDLENKAVMLTALSCVRAMIAQVIAMKEDQILEEMAVKAGHTKAEVLEDVTLAGNEAAAFQQHLARREHANCSFRACGRFVIPRGYMVFATNVPAHVPPEIRKEVTGVAGVAVDIADISQTDYLRLKRDPSALTDVEDLTPLIDACGVPTINGQTILDMELVSDANGIEQMQYSVHGQEPAQIPVTDFLKKALVKFAPIVIRTKRKRIFPEDMQGCQEGVSFALSFEDISERFGPCAKSSRSDS